MSTAIFTTNSGAVTGNALTQKDTLWAWYRKVALRFFSLYFALQIIPLDWKFYRDLFSPRLIQHPLAYLFTLAHYTPRFFSGGQTFLNWVPLIIIALIVTAIWINFEKKNRFKISYEALYYRARTLARYRLAIAVFAYGLVKFFPLLAPYPSLSNLNTRYGDYTDWKVFSLSLGIVPSYQSFLGLVEVIAGLLLLNRKTASFGAFILAFFLGNIFFSNLAYEGGEYVYSAFLITLALFIFSFDALRLYRLIGLGKATSPNSYRPLFRKTWKTARVVIKAATLLFLFLYGYLAWASYQNDGYKYPSGKGLPGSAGIYNVSVFVINKDTLPYSSTDSSRWQDVVFEKWPTISIRSGRHVIIDSSNIESIPLTHDDQTYELEGSVSRHYYDYAFNAADSILTLHNRNKYYRGETLKLKYNKPDEGTIVLRGVNEKNDSVYVQLDRQNKKYLLEEARKAGRRKAFKL